MSRGCTARSKGSPTPRRPRWTGLRPRCTQHRRNLCSRSLHMRRRTFPREARRRRAAGCPFVGKRRLRDIPRPPRKLRRVSAPVFRRRASAQCMHMIPTRCRPRRKPARRGIRSVPCTPAWRPFDRAFLRAARCRTLPWPRPKRFPEQQPLAKPEKRPAQASKRLSPIHPSHILRPTLFTRRPAWQARPLNRSQSGADHRDEGLLSGRR
jgi:hypothetical protein